MKNALVLVAPAAAGLLSHARVLEHCAVAFVAFCLCASGVYLLNDVRDRGAAALAASPHAAALRRLSLAHDQVGDAGAAALASSESLGGLVTLDLEGNAVGDVQIEIIAEGVQV